MVVVELVEVFDLSMFMLLASAKILEEPKKYLFLMGYGFLGMIILWFIFNWALALGFLFMHLVLSVWFIRKYWLSDIEAICWSEEKEDLQVLRKL